MSEWMPWLHLVVVTQDQRIKPHRKRVGEVVLRERDEIG